MSPAKQSRKIIIAGGTGMIGKPIISALLATGLHEVSAITRPESTSPIPGGVTMHRGSYDDEEFLTAALKGKDVLISVLNWKAIDAQVPLFRAAAAAGVPWIVPNEFGSDVTNEKLVQEISVMAVKPKFRALINDLGVSSWIGIVNNPWFDLFVRTGTWGLDFKARKAVVFDEGEDKANFTTLADVGKSLAAILSLPESELARWKNKFVYLSSFRVSQRDVIASALRATGTSGADWTVVKEDKAAAAEVIKAAMSKGDMIAGVKLLLLNMFRDGYGGDYQDKVIDYKALEMETETLDEAVARLAKELLA